MRSSGLSRSRRFTELYIVIRWRKLTMQDHCRQVKSNHLSGFCFLLPNHVPLKIVEVFRMLEALYSGRIDLGIGRAPGTDQLTALAIRRSTQALRADDFPDQMAELLALADDAFPDDHPFRAIAAVPVSVALPPVWLLGSSDFSARLAARLGLGFAFARHINPDWMAPAMRSYRQQFRPSTHLAQPHAILTVLPCVRKRRVMQNGWRIHSTWPGCACAVANRVNFLARRKPRPIPTRRRNKPCCAPTANG